MSLGSIIRGGMLCCSNLSTAKLLASWCVTAEAAMLRVSEQSHHVDMCGTCVSKHQHCVGYPWICQHMHIQFIIRAGDCFKLVMNLAAAVDSDVPSAALTLTLLIYVGLRDACNCTVRCMQCRLWFRSEPSAECAASTCPIGYVVTPIITEPNYVAYYFFAK